jgi:hypothetical protein
MKNSSVCPKCNSSDIIRIPGKVGAYGTGNNIQVGKTVFSTIPVTRYMCGSCGYIEEWMDSDLNIQEIKRGFQNRKENEAVDTTNLGFLVFVVFLLFVLFAFVLILILLPI